MRIKKIFNLFFPLLGCAAIGWGLYLFCEQQTQGFRPYLILSNLPNDPRWEAPPLPSKEQKQIDKLLSQPFTFLGSGGWCYAFLGQDQKTVLKFYKHTHLLPSSLFKDFSWDKLLLKSEQLPQNASYFQEFNFNSCMLLLKEAKERTGLLYVHLNKTQGLHKPVVLYDNIGIKHIIDLDQTEFVVQKRADPLIPHLQGLIQEEKIEEAKRCIDDVFVCLLCLYRSGIRDRDTSLRKNFGFIEERAVTFDLSSFEYDASLKRPVNNRKELRIKTKRLAHWLKKYHPDLYLHYEERMNGLDSGSL